MATPRRLWIHSALPLGIGNPARRRFDHFAFQFQTRIGQTNYKPEHLIADAADAAGHLRELPRNARDKRRGRVVTRA
jgi:hypothetical protein